MSGEEPPTLMLHWQCYTCGMTATCVGNAVAELAWLDHMETHSAKTNYGAWAWHVMPLPLEFS